MSVDKKWRIRDAASQLVDERLAFLPAADKAAKLGKSKDSGGRGKRPPSDVLSLATPDDFPVAAALEVLKLKKAEIIQAAFSAAATSVLQALKQKADGKMDEDASIDNEEDDSPIEGLPKHLIDRQQVRKVRISSLTRSAENKEWAKKRVDEPTTTATRKGRKRPAEGNQQAQPATKKVNNSKSNKAPSSEATTTETSPAIAPKFTRNTPASSAAALDHRFTNSRAILCAAGNLTIAALTPDLPNHALEPNDVPQKEKDTVNLGAVLVDASVYSQRAIEISKNASNRSKLRYKYRKENARFQLESANGNSDSDRYFVPMPNLFGWRETNASPFSDFLFEKGDCVPYKPQLNELTDAWKEFCKSRLQAIVEKGGHALFVDMQWYSRHARLADFLKTLREPGLSSQEASFGPHLIVTMQPDTVKFAQEFHDMRGNIRLVLDRNDEEDNELRVLLYEGTSAERRKLRRHFPQAVGLAASPFHVIVISYTDLLQDYLHFCQVPFEVVLLDNGASWMAASNGDPNSSLATIWEQGIWNGHQHVGVAGAFGGEGATTDKWDFEAEQINESVMKDACIGLTARSRIMTASQLTSEHRASNVEVLPVSGVVSFLSPHFASVVREEWDRSNISKDTESMQHFSKLVARSTVVHHRASPIRDMHEMAISALEGKIGFPERFGDPIAPSFVSDDEFVSADKVTFSRRGCLSWLGSKSVDWLRYELGKADFEPILNAMKVSVKHGSFCEEITTASSTTSSGVTGQVSGTAAYRMAVCCGRHFGSDQGLRQHISAQHAPPGTWLCRTCGIDCITSQARTHHERTCGQPANGSSEPGSSAGANPTVGQGPKNTVGKKKTQRTGTSTQQGGVSAEEKDPDGSLRVPGYRGVWVNKQGKHFIKVDGARYQGEGEGGHVILFDTNDAAARKYDEIISGENAEGPLELNFKPDGKRNIYEDATSSTASGLGGSAANVVPLLSVINIKDLPPDVKPLLRDPRQTSRTGGNSKRHVYAYRGVCRQARKGHDRWQSQISFMGVNHYLGTFDSEWDAAAIYAWAHLILYGEEATKQAQKEGEEAAAAYEQEKKDIAAGKIPAPPPKPEKKKQQPRKKPDKAKATKKGKPSKPESAVAENEEKSEPLKKRKPKPKERVNTEKKTKVDGKSAREEKEEMNATLSLGVVKTRVFGVREKLEKLDVSELESMASSRIRASRDLFYCVGDLKSSASPAIEAARPCLPISDSRSTTQFGAAMLVGLSIDIGWSLEDFIESNIDDEASRMTAVQVLAAEYDEEGVNEKFRCLIQGSVCVLGRATESMVRVFRKLLGSSIVLGSSMGDIDCHIGGLPFTCSRRAACIRYTGGGYEICCLNHEDVVTLNGRRLSTGSKWVSIKSNDVCSIGPRVFAFLLPQQV
mmetsp:Transcript_8344/g.18907  ORF Transcript_8344/g.18907 Transcript_8344/m.18907 type:complete len:1392 (-) Transcript_8344:222-4397(-)